MASNAFQALDISFDVEFVTPLSPVNRLLQDVGLGQIKWQASMRRTPMSVSLFALLSLVFAMAVRCGVAEAANATLVPELSHDTSRALTELAPTITAPIGGPGTVGSLVSAPAGITAGPSFEGIGQGFSGPGGIFQVSAAPPNPEGDVGNELYVQVVNSALAVFDKNGAVRFGPMPLETLWAQFDAPCAQPNVGNARIRYDRIADRWVLVQTANGGGLGPFFECIAVSATADPTGTYHRYAFALPTLADFPQLALWPDGYYLTFNQFADNRFDHARLCAGDRATLLTGVSSTLQCFDMPAGWSAPMAADFDGVLPPPAGSPNLVVSLGAGRLGLFKLHLDHAAPSNSSLSGPTELPVEAFTPLCAASSCVEQPGTPNRLEASGDRLSSRVVYRNFGTHQAALLTHAVALPSGGGLRWYELRDPLSETPTLAQQGTFAPDAAYRFLGSVAFDKAGDVALGYAVSSATISPSVRFAARLAADPRGLFPLSEGSLVEGTGSQSRIDRYGALSSLRIDPTDDCQFWFTQQYQAVSGTFAWSTRIGAFRLDHCAAVVPPTPLFTAPVDGRTVTGTIDITATLPESSGTVSAVRFTLPDGSVFDDPSPPYATTLNTLALANGPTQVRAVALDGAGKAGSPAQVSMTVRNIFNQLPTVVLSPPVNPLSGVVTFVATASDPDGTVTKVSFVLPDGSSVEDTTAPYTATFDTGSLQPGTYFVRARVTDNFGATTSDFQQVTVVRPPCNPVVTQTASGLPLPIPDNNATGITVPIAVSATGNITAVRVSLNVAHTFRGDLAIDLVSPSGTKVNLSNRAGGSADNVILTDFDVSGFSGPAAGTWTLRIRDLAPSDIGRLNSFALTLGVSCYSSATKWSGSATPNLPLVDNGTTCSSLNVATTDPAADASDVKLSFRLQHSFRRSLRIRLLHGGNASVVIEEGALPTTAGEVQRSPLPVPGFQGSPAGTWTLCIDDTDAFKDSGTLFTWGVNN